MQAKIVRNLLFVDLFINCYSVEYIQFHKVKAFSDIQHGVIPQSGRNANG
jgi:hypothetical protein